MTDDEIIEAMWAYILTHADDESADLDDCDDEENIEIVSVH